MCLKIKRNLAALLGRGLVFFALACLTEIPLAASVYAQPTSTAATVNVAVVGPLTPSSKAFGIAHLQGITLAVKEYNQEHSQLGRSIQLKLYDDQATPAIGAAVTKALEDSDVAAVLGPANSAVSRTVIDQIQEKQLSLPVISSISTASTLTENLQTERFFRANVSDRKRMNTLLGLIFGDDNLKPRRLVAFYEKGDAFGEGMLSDAKSWLKTNELNFLNNNLIEIPYPRDVTREAAQQLVTTATAQNFGDRKDAVLVLGIAQDAVTFIEAIRTKDLPPQIYFNEPDALVFKSAAKAGIPIAGVHILSVYWPQNATVNSFKPSFKKLFNEEPSFSAALSYDAARLLFRAIDLALDKAVAGENTKSFRDRIVQNLHSDEGPFLQPVLDGNHKFANGEYVALEFQGLQYDAKGDLIRWDEDPAAKPSIALGTGKTIVLPTVINLVMVVVFGFLGSTFREFTRTPPSDFGQFAKRLASPMSLIIDPAISLIVFGCVFLLTVITKRTLLEIGGDAALIYNIGSVAFGFVAGFLGIRALYATIRRLGINVQERDITGPAVTAARDSST